MPPPSQMPLVCWQRRLIIQSRLWTSKSIHRTSDLSESTAPAYSCYLCIGFFILFSKKTLYNILILRNEPWQLNDRPDGIWFCDDTSKATPLTKGLGTTFGEKRQNGSWTVKVELFQIEKGFTISASFGAFLLKNPYFLQVLNWEKLLKNALLTKTTKN